MYANWTAKTCAESGIEFECRKVDKKNLEDKIVEANEDNSIHGIMVYYPVYGDRQVIFIKLYRYYKLIYDFIGSILTKCSQ
jgi:methylenetetrahydrofolate dehydrogenase (NAD+)